MDKFITCAIKHVLAINNKYLPTLRYQIKLGQYLITSKQITASDAITQLNAMVIELKTK